MEQKFNIFNQPEIPSIVLCNPNKEELYAIDRLIYDMKLNLRFNALSEFSFSMPKSIDGNKTTISAYSYLKSKRLIKIDTVGYFIINTVEEEDDGSVPVANVQCQSLEAELLYKRLTAYEVTSVKFYTAGDGNTLLQKMVNLCPTWSVGDVDITLANEYRSFSTNDTNVYSFLMNDVSKAFDCVFFFDTINKRISANLVTNLTATNDTGIFLSYDNLVKNSTLSELSDELATALYGYGGNGLDIRPVNPMLGAVYNFDYYIQYPSNLSWHSEWMSDELRSALIEWKDRLSKAEAGNYTGGNTTYVPYNTALQNLKTNLDLSSNYITYPTVSNATSLLDSKSILSTLENELAVLEAKKKIEVDSNVINQLNSDIANTTANITTAKNKVASYANYVDRYIYSGTDSAKTGSIYKVLSTMNNSILLDTTLLSEAQYSINKALSVYSYYLNIYKNELETLSGSELNAKKEQINTFKTYISNAGGASVTDSDDPKATENTLQVVNNQANRTMYDTSTENFLAFSTLVTALRDTNNSIAGYKTTLSEYRSEYAALEVELKAAIEGGLSKTEIKKNLKKKQKQIDTVSGYIASAEALVTMITTKLEQQRNYVSLTNPVYFNTTLQKEMTPFIIENTYQNENIIITDSMGSGEIQEQAQKLYNQTKVVSEKVSQPRYEFTFEVVNFINLPEYEKFTTDLDLGKAVTVETPSGYVKTVLLEIELEYDKPENASLTFSNRFRLDNGNFQYSDLMGEVVKTGGSVSYGKYKWDNFDQNYRDDVNSFINSALDASKNAVISATNQEIKINEAGLQGKRYISEGNYSDEQVWLTSNTLAFTSDSWSSANLAIGKIDTGNKNQAGESIYAYGIVGDYIVGKMILGTNLKIANNDNTVTINNLGIKVQKTGGLANVTIDTANGITISNATGNATLYTDLTSGNLTLAGGIEATSGNIAGWKIEAGKISSKGNVGGVSNQEVHFLSSWDSQDKQVLKIGNVFYVKANGDGYFAGNVQAKNILSGKADDSSPDYGTLDGSAITAATLGSGKLKTQDHFDIQNATLNGGVYLRGTVYAGSTDEQANTAIFNIQTSAGVVRFHFINGILVQNNSGGGA